MSWKLYSMSSKLSFCCPLHLCATIACKNKLILFVAACAAALPLFSAVGQLPAGPGAVVTGATVLAAAAQIHVSLPHLFNGLVLTEWYHTVTVCKLHLGGGSWCWWWWWGDCNLSRQLRVFELHIWMMTPSLTLPDTLFLIQEVCLLWKHTNTPEGPHAVAEQQLVCKKKWRNSWGQQEKLPSI